MVLDFMELKDFIDKSGLKQKAIAEKSGVPEVQLCLILQGKRKCEVGEQASICEALGVKVDRFIRKKPRMPDKTKSCQCVITNSQCLNFLTLCTLQTFAALYDANASLSTPPLTQFQFSESDEQIVVHAHQLAEMKEHPVWWNILNECSLMRFLIRFPAAATPY